MHISTASERSFHLEYWHEYLSIISRALSPRIEERYLAISRNLERLEYSGLISSGEHGTVLGRVLFMAQQMEHKLRSIGQQWQTTPASFDEVISRNVAMQRRLAGLTQQELDDWLESERNFDSTRATHFGIGRDHNTVGLEELALLAIRFHVPVIELLLAVEGCDLEINGQIWLTRAQTIGVSLVKGAASERADCSGTR
jgi:hypothetical protein